MASYIVTVIILGVASVTAAAAMIYHAVRLIMRRIKLNHSIMLVELKTHKIMYWIFAGVIGALMIWLILHMTDGDSHFTEKFAAVFGVDRVLAVVAYIFPLIAMIGAEAFIIALCIGKNAVVDKGIYTDYSMLDWHQVHDYAIDEERGILVLSADRATFSTLKSLTTPFRVKKTDIEKLKFILNKNKNKFSDFGV
ncbi:MAG: hypothetical protein J1G38_03370 [Clostridiales bacterium]|nr:hypothetical protein [Clostridiales bacterium]